MAHRVVMPSFGMYTAEGTIASWCKSNGALVEAGDVIVEIETEKAVEEVAAPVNGVLHHVLAKGAQLQIESLLGYILAPGEAPPLEEQGLSSGPSTVDTTVRERESGSELRASPIAKKLARDHKIDLASVKGSGPAGRIVEADVRSALERGARKPPALQPLASQRTPLSTMRRTIGERLRRSVDTAVSLTLTREIRAEALASARAAVSKTGGQPVPYDAFFVKAIASALREFPQMNATIEDGELVVFTEVNVGVAVSLAGGLVVPVIRGADSRSLVDVARAIREFGAQAADGRLALDDTLGGTATVTNLGGFGVDAFTPVLNPPQAVILGVGRIRSTPVVENGAVIAGTTCVLSLTFDHRVTDGAPAARLLDAIQNLLSDDTRLASW